jgi:hypothetical protein
MYTRLRKHQTLRIYKCDYTQTIAAIFIRPCASLFLSSNSVNTSPSRDNLIYTADRSNWYHANKVLFRHAGNVGPECYRPCLYRIFTGFVTPLSSGLQQAKQQRSYKSLGLKQAYYSVSNTKLPAEALLLQIIPCNITTLYTVWRRIMLLWDSVLRLVWCYDDDITYAIFSLAVPVPLMIIVTYKFWSVMAALYILLLNVRSATGQQVTHRKWPNWIIF